jgi:hypothetical protein
MNLLARCWPNTLVRVAELCWLSRIMHIHVNRRNDLARQKNGYWQPRRYQPQVVRESPWRRASPRLFGGTSGLIISRWGSLPAVSQTRRDGAG